MAGEAAPVAALHQLRALVAAAEQLLAGGGVRGQQLAAPHELVGQAAVALQLDGGHALGAGAGVAAADGAGVGAARGPRPGARCLALLAVCPRTRIVRCTSHLDTHIFHRHKKYFLQTLRCVPCDIHGCRCDYHKAIADHTSGHRRRVWPGGTGRRPSRGRPDTSR